MKLSVEEDRFLRLWMRDEIQYEKGQGEAKRLQLGHRVIPADLATLIAAAFPDPEEQEEAALAVSPNIHPSWPWTDDGFRVRLAEARTILAERSAEIESHV